MSKNIITPKRVSFEDALRNLASRLTGQPAAKLPRTQEGIVQFMAENVPTPAELAEAITQEVVAGLAAREPAQDGEGEAGSTSVSPADEPPQEAAETAEKPKRGPKNRASE